jgi:hypothetical protein
MPAENARRTTLAVKMNGDEDTVLVCLAPEGLDSFDVGNIVAELERSGASFHQFSEKMADMGFAIVNQVSVVMQFNDFKLVPASFQKTAH